MIRAILTDIEGTTTAIAFVHEVLFPYAARHLPEFVRAHADEADVAAALDATRREAGLAPDAGIDAVLAVLLDWMRADRKITPLKTLQGFVWEAGYRDGSLKGHVWPDVVPVLRRWRDAGLGRYVYSSGSIAAQKLLFGHTAEGDLTGLFSGYFDTTSGGKREAASYARIAQAIGSSPAEILFLSDIAEELDAAQASGMRTCQLVRAQDGTQAAGRHAVAREFGEIVTD